MGRTWGTLAVPVGAVSAMLAVGLAATVSPSRATPVRADPGEVYSPVAAGERLPDGFHQIMPRDLIEPVYDPAFVAAADAGWPDDADVIGIEIDGRAKAYPVSLLNGREMVIDELAGVPIVVTWCPVCSTAVVHRRVVDGEEVVFGVQGALYRNAMTWWDHDTGSIWSQPLGEAIAGPRRGASVEMLPSSFTTWRAWRTSHPDSQALDVPAAPTSFDLTGLVVVVDLDDDVRGYRVSDLRRHGVVNDVVAGVELAVVVDPVEPDRWAVYSRRVDGELIELEVTGAPGREVLRDRVGGSTFGFERGLGTGGPLGEHRLAQLPAMVAEIGGGPMRFPVFGAFWPDGSIWRADP